MRRLHRIIRIGTRASLLAMTQSGQVRKALQRCFPKNRFELVPIRTHGDEFQSVEIFKRLGVGVFTKAIERELRSGAIDMAVHSLKDLPTDLPRSLTLASVPKREDTSDVLLSRKGYTLQSLPAGARVGTGSLRRQRQMKRFRPDVKTVDLRGNLDTRAGKVLKEGSLDAIIVARAGVSRIGRFERYCRTLPSERWLPAVGQGALGIQTRADDAEAIRMAKRLQHAPSRLACDAERAFLGTLRGGCRIPLGFGCRMQAGRIHLKAELYDARAEGFLMAEVVCRKQDASVQARRLATALLKKGGARLMRRARTGGSA